VSISITAVLKINLNSKELSPMDAQKWVEVKVQEVKRRHEEKQLAAKQLIVEIDLKKMQAPELWSRIRSLIKGRVELFCRGLGEDVLAFEVSTVNEAIVRLRDTPTKISAFFDPHTLKLSCRLTNTTIHYEPHVQNGKVVFIEDQGPQCREEDIAERFVNNIIDLA
jgi:hypothetical protein